jgi:hypothetical protein
MPIEPRNILETYFETGDVPTADQFKSLIDSYVHKLDDGVTVYEQVNTELSFGIGITTPQGRLGVKALDDDYQTLTSFYQPETDFPSWFMSLNPGIQDNPGFSIDESTALGKTSRLFIQQSTGNIGLGTLVPNQRIDIQQSSPSGLSGMRLLNLANVVNNGWFIGEFAGNGSGVDGSFSIYENLVSANTEYFKIIPGGNVGIGVSNPDTTLHVSRPVIDPDTDLDLRLGTGIFITGPDTSNVVYDWRGLQARLGSYIDPTDPSTIVITAGELNLQRVGGPILIHGDMDIALTSKGIITDTGFLGLGTITPLERIDIDGAIRIGNTQTTNTGTIRFNGDFEGYMNNAWVSLTAGGGGGSGPWVQGQQQTIYYLNGTTSRAAVGQITADATLHIKDTESVTAGNIAAIVHNTSQTTSVDPNDNRVGVRIANTGIWSLSESKDIGLYISNVNGQVAPQQNLAAVLNGNVLVGNLIANQQVIGPGGKNVLALQTSDSVPTSSPNTNTVQLFGSATAGGTGILNIMVGNGDVVNIYKEAALSARDNSVISEVDYNDVVAGVINNLRIRLNELEDRLKNIALIS